MQIFVALQGGRTRALSHDDLHGVKVSLLKEQLACYEGIPHNEQRLICGHKELHDDDVLAGADLLFLSLSLRVVGGKGGFGSLLRGAPSKIGQKKTDNFDACRDLSGRRLRHQNNEKKIKEWIQQAHERELETVALQHIKKLANQHHFDDNKYTNESDSIKESVSTALERGIDEAKKTNALSSNRFKKSEKEDEVSGPFKKRAWDEIDDIPDLDEESEPETKEKKPKKHALSPTSKSASTPSPPSSPATTTTTTTSTTTITTTTTTSTSTAQPVPESTSLAQPEIESSSSSSSLSSPPPAAPVHTPVDLSKYETAKDLEAIGGDPLKAELQRLGLLCGGTVADRAARLFLLKTTPLAKLDKKHFAKKNNKK